MATTHVRMETYYVKSRTEEIRPIMTKAYIVPTLRTDLITVKSLNRQGYRVIHDADSEESGTYPVLNGKIDISKSFAFMSEYSKSFLYQNRNHVGTTIWQGLRLCEMAQKAGSYYNKRNS